tara:strand:+ start:1349 stop:1528 length:180 start_codon:yes stop_codon:yes gene_type:complete
MDDNTPLTTDFKAGMISALCPKRALRATPAAVQKVVMRKVTTYSKKCKKVQKEQMKKSK